MLDGQKERFETTGKQGIFINTVGPFSRRSGVVRANVTCVLSPGQVWEPTIACRSLTHFSVRV